MSNPNSKEQEQRIRKITINLVNKSDSSQLAKSEFLNKFNSPLDKATLEILIKNQQKMQEWIAKDKKNLQFFLEDPIASLHEADIRLEEKILENINNIRQKNLVERPQIANLGSKDKWKVDEIKFEASTTTATNTLKSTLDLSPRRE